MTDLLNPNQKRALTITLRIFEESLRQAKLWLDGYEENGILYQRKAELPPRQRAIAQESVDAAFKEIARLATLFDLQSQEGNTVFLIAGQMSAHWAALEDMRSKKLNRFGEVDPRLADVLDPAIEQLSRLALVLATLL